LRILTVAAEVAPFAKTGGLADVAAALPKALAERGHEVALILPKYLMVDRGGFETEPIDLPLLFRIDDEERTGWIHRGKIPDTDIPVYFVVNDDFYNRNGLYQEGGKDYPDNLARFTFFCRSVLELLRSDEFPADVVHCHDWQTALIPIYLKTLERENPILSKIKTLFTVHNIAYQGVFPSDQLHITGLPGDVFTPEKIEFYGDINLLKGGLVYSDRVTTVSERYAKELLTSEFGHGLGPVVVSIQDRLVGILNGVDYETWDPETDKTLPANYSMENLSGKAVCKEALQKKFGLPTLPEVPILSTVCRFDRQKGVDLIGQVLDFLLLSEEIQFVALGSGDPEYERMFKELRDRFPQQVGVHVGQSEDLAHLIEAGSDIFLMPSRYEPCGLGQLYSLKYGTPPVVHHAGGLADTVRDYNDAQKDGYGFAFDRFEEKAFIRAIKRALFAYRDKTAWQAVQGRGMACDFSWDPSAQKYEKLYQDLVESRG